MLDWLILADDATGALDTGVQFAARGVTTYVALSPSADMPSGMRALVLNTNSRHDTPELAEYKVEQAVVTYLRRGVCHFYKKTDSVLRGNVGVEMAALRRATEKTICFAPFYPAQSRATRAGVQFVRGVRVDQSEFARDPATPVRQANIVRLLAGAGLRAQIVAPPYDLKGELPDALIFDGETEDEMTDIAALLRKTGLDAVTAGCAGLAAHLPEKKTGCIQAEVVCGPVLIVSGSASPTTLRQIRVARMQGIAVVRPTLEQIRDGARGISDRCVEEICAGRSTILCSAEEGVPHFSPGTLAPGLLQERLADWAEQILRQSRVGAWMAVGGDFLFTALSHAGIDGVWPLREIAPGVALCRAGRRVLLTKSGGFGEETLLAQIAKGALR